MSGYFKHTDIIIVTFNNIGFLTKCLRSIDTCHLGIPYTIHIVNNGVLGSLDSFKDKNTRVYDTGSNLGWIGGINFMQGKVLGPYILFLNDDTQFIHFDKQWLKRLIIPFIKYDNIGATGPVSNNVSGYQQINSVNPVPKMNVSPLLIGFCLLSTKENLDKIGWLDGSLRGGDDLDLSIKLQDIGKSLVTCRNVTVLHHYAATGKRVHGQYWDSVDHGEHIEIDLIKKHGLKRFLKFQSGESMVHANIRNNS